MARPLPFEPLYLDPQAHLRERLEQAPVEHAEAVLDSYKLLQDLRDAHVFEVLHGVLAKGDKIVELAVDAVKEPDAIRGLRNLIILSKDFRLHRSRAASRRRRRRAGNSRGGEAAGCRAAGIFCSAAAIAP